VRTLASLRAQGPGFTTTNLLSFRLDPARNGYTQTQSRKLMRDLLAALRTLPEVESVGLSTAELLEGGSWGMLITVESERRFVTDRVVHCNAVSPEFFETLGARVISGRDFSERDAHGLQDLGSGSVSTHYQELAFRSAIVNESLAKRYFGDRSPIGARLGVGNRPDTRADIEIVGVVKTFSYTGLRATEDQAFFPFFESPISAGGFYVRTRTQSESAFSSIRTAVRQLDPSLPVTGLRTLDDQLDRSLVNERLLAILASAFAALAILLAVVGLYGVMSFVVSRRTREIGIRLALGAPRSAAVWLIVRDASIMVVAGLAIALPTVWGLGRLIENQAVWSARHGWDHDRRRCGPRCPRRAWSQRSAGPESYYRQSGGSVALRIGRDLPALVPLFAITVTYKEVGLERGRRAPRGDSRWRLTDKIAVRRSPPTFARRSFQSKAVPARVWSIDRVHRPAALHRCSGSRGHTWHGPVRGGHETHREPRPAARNGSPTGLRAACQ